MAGPLSHVRVLDLSRIMAGPWAGQIFADLGADVIKVERPVVGDDTRTWGPPFLKDRDGQPTREAGYYLAVNRGKRSITLDLDKPEGQAVVRAIAAKSDIVLENFKAGTLSKFGLSYDQLKAVNPALIYCSITGFGQTGPRRDDPAYDFLIQAMGGLMSVTGEPDGAPGGKPEKVGVPIVDIMSGMYAVIGCLAALAHRKETGVGDYVDIAMLDVQVAFLANQAMNYLVSGNPPRRTGNAHPNIQPQDVFRASDGYFVLVVGNDSQFARLAKAIGRPELATDPRFALNPDRVRNNPALTGLLTEIFATNTTAHWTTACAAAGVPAGPINTVPQVFEDAQVQHRGMRIDVPHPLAGEVPLVKSPMLFRNSELAFDRAPPLLGQHTQEILRELGLDEPSAKTDKD